MRRYVDGDEVELRDSDARVELSGDRLAVHVGDKTHTALVRIVGDVALVSYEGRQYRVERTSKLRLRSAAVSNGELRASMPGQVVDVFFKPGAPVRAGQAVLVVEAMKTQQPFVAPHDGTISRIEVAKGDQVTDGQLLAVVSSE